MLSGMAALNGGLGSTGLSNGSAGPMDALTQAYSGIQQYAAAALPTLYSQSLLQQQSAAGSQKEGMDTHTLGIGYVGSLELKLVQLQLSNAADMELHQ